MGDYYLLEVDMDIIFEMAKTILWILFQFLIVVWGVIMFIVTAFVLAIGVHAASYYNRRRKSNKKEKR